LGQGLGLVLSKQGMLLWDATGASVPVAATMIRGIMGLAGFSITLLLRGEVREMVLPLQSRISFGAMMGSVILGPFLGVSLSLMAVSMTSSGVAQTLMSLTPVFIIWPSHILFHSRIRAIEVLGAIIAVAGAALLF
ncbi:MAG: EamA family transporter, partial [Bacteroidaceae bacterium]|nr:EamA family transporter [Bacteroidaceae bacterium]